VVRARPPIPLAVLAALALIAVALGAAAGGASATLLGACPGAPSDHALCGTVTVPLDRSGAVPGTIGLRVRALGPSAGGAASGVVLALAGGPGQAATPLLDSFATVLKPVLRTRELVTFDQRGTGASGRLRCAALAQPGSLSSVVQRCATELGPGRAAYTTAATVEDVEAVRSALGADKLIVYGASYGTKVALAYAATYPQHVDRLVLDSVVPPDGVDPFQRSTLTSVPRVLRAVCAGACRFTHDPGADAAALARRLGRRLLRGPVVDGRGHVRRAAVDEQELLGLLLDGDFDRYLRASLPAAVHGALTGDPAPLLRMLGHASDGSLAAGTDSDALYIATTCEDGRVPWPAGTPLQQRRAAEAAAAAAIPGSAFAPFDRATALALGLADLCRGWPESPVAQPQPPLPSTPTLILSGDEDLRTPRADAAALAGRLPGAHLLEVPDTGHGVLFSDPTDCAARAVAAFVGGLVPGDCRLHPSLVPALAPAPRRLADVRSVGRLPRRSGRTVEAVLRTLDDASGELLEQALAGAARPHPFGGLRAGSAAFDRARGLRLRAYAYVPGVEVSGLVSSRRRSFTVTVGGRDAAHGRLTFSRRGVAGTLDGAPVRVSARALRAGSGSAAMAAVASLARRADAAAAAHAADDPRPFRP
jgi:pimeloyl-ACP methyl ester carboxylesterase